MDTVIRQGAMLDRSSPYKPKTYSGHNELDKITHKSYLLISEGINMRVKIFISGLALFFIFIYCNSPADPEVEKTLTQNSGPIDGENPVSQIELEITTIPESMCFLE